MIEKPAPHTGMATNTLPNFLRDRRERLHPESQERRRTPGLRREEVAARAGVSVTWYTWLEQGRGGVPSDAVLERLARALELDDTAREMLFLLAHDRPPPRKPAPVPEVTASLQRALDNIAVPAFVKTPTFQIVAWNRPAAAVLGDYAKAPYRDRNLLRRIFSPGAEDSMPADVIDGVRRGCLASFRVDITRAGWSDEANDLIEELMTASADFRRLWDEGEVRSHGVMLKRIVRPGVGEISLESSVFAVDGSEGLSMFIFSPVDDVSARAIEQLVHHWGT
ncbi:MAG: helix-turn-helix transcriptional regulator [Kofleriaceae bacterium]